MGMSTSGSRRSQSRYDGARRWLTEAILGGFYAVHRELGAGFLESVYEVSLAIALRQMGLKVEQQAAVAVSFRGVTVGAFKIDLLVESLVAVELKASSRLVQSHEAQLLNYLRACDLEVGLLLNFGVRPTFRRLAYSNERKRVMVRRVNGANPLEKSHRNGD